MDGPAFVIAVCTGPGGIPKDPRDGPVPIGIKGLHGDRQRDRERHGGPDQAVCVYLSEDYASFAREGIELPGPGAFGENVTLGGVPGTTIRIGDLWAAGHLRLEVTQPRLPCANLEVYGTDFPRLVLATRRTGFYCRVLRAGTLAAGDRLCLERAGSVGLLQAIIARKDHAPGGASEEWRRDLAAVLAEPALGSSWRRALEKRFHDGR